MSSNEGGYESDPCDIEESNQNIHIDDVPPSQIPPSQTSKEGSTSSYYCPSAMLKVYAKGPFNIKKPLL